MCAKATKLPIFIKWKRHRPKMQSRATAFRVIIVKPLVHEKPGITCSFWVMKKKKITEISQPYCSFIPGNTCFSKQDSEAQVPARYCIIHSLYIILQWNFCTVLRLWGFIISPRAKQSKAVKLQQPVCINNTNRTVPIVEIKALGMVGCLWKWIFWGLVYISDKIECMFTVDVENGLEGSYFLSKTHLFSFPISFSCLQKGDVDKRGKNE